MGAKTDFDLEGRGSVHLRYGRHVPVARRAARHARASNPSPPTCGERRARTVPAGRPDRVGNGSGPIHRRPFRPDAKRFCCRPRPCGSRARKGRAGGRRRDRGPGFPVVGDSRSHLEPEPVERAVHQGREGKRGVRVGGKEPGGGGSTHEALRRLFRHCRGLSHGRHRGPPLAEARFAGERRRGPVRALARHPPPCRQAGHGLPRHVSRRDRRD